MTARLALFFCLVCNDLCFCGENVTAPKFYILRAITRSSEDQSQHEANHPPDQNNKHTNKETLNMVWKAERVPWFDVGEQLADDGTGLRLEAIIVWRLPDEFAHRANPSAAVRLHVESATGLGLWGSVVACYELLGEVPEDLSELFNPGVFKNCFPILRAGDPIPGTVNFELSPILQELTEDNDRSWLLMRLAPASETVDVQTLDAAQDDFVRFSGGEFFSPTLFLK